MSNTPTLLLKGQMDNMGPVAVIEDSSNYWHGYPCAWRVRLTTSPQPTSLPDNFAYTIRDVKIGDWIASSVGGIAVKISSIEEILNDNEAIIIVEDEDFYNTFADNQGMGEGIGPSGPCIVFTITESGLPALGPFPNEILPDTVEGDVLARFLHLGKLKAGGSNFLQDPEGVKFEDGAITNWLIGKTTVSTAVGDLNLLLGKLIPGGPAPLSSKSITIKGSSNSRNSADILLATGVADNAESGIVAGSKVFRISSNNAVSNDISGFGESNSGTLKARINNVDSGSITLTEGSDVGEDGALTIVSEVDYPSDRPGFWTALTAKVSSTVPAGVNKFELVHSSSGAATPAIFVYDTLTSLPASSNVSVTEGKAGTLNYSSGIPHYTSGSSLRVSGTVSNLSGLTYLSSNIVEFSTNPMIGRLNLNPGVPGIPEILNANHAPVILTNLELSLSGDAHASSIVRLRGFNPQGDGPFSDSSTVVNYMNGTPSGCVIESGKPMSGSTLKRIRSSSGPKPDDVVTNYSDASFDSGGSSFTGDASASHEAVVRGGSLRFDKTNYSSGFLPVGPDYSGKDDVQYATFIIKKVASNMRITFSGSDPSELYIKLPGLTQAMPNATNGWWDAKKQADFAPGQWPGSFGAGDGCLSQKSGSTYNITFGSASSAGANDNVVMIRIGLTAGQVISNMTIDI